MNVGSLFFGLMIVIVGVIFLRFHQAIADNLGGGIGDYDKYKLYALITCGLGFLVMLNIHTLFFEWIANLIFRR